MNFPRSIRYTAACLGAGAILSGCLSSQTESTEPNDLATAAAIAPGTETYNWSNATPYGTVYDIGAGRKYSNDDYDLAYTALMGGAPGGGTEYRAWKYIHGTTWQVNGLLRRIDLGPNGMAWGVTEGVNVKQEISTGNWVDRGQGLDVGVGANGAVWKIGYDFSCGSPCVEHWAYKWNGSSWVQYGIKGSRIDVDPTGLAWVVKASGEVWMINGTNSFTQVTGISAMDIGIGGSMGSVFAVSNAMADSYGNRKVYHLVGTNTWKLINGIGVAVSVDYANRPYVVSMDGRGYQGNLPR